METKPDHPRQTLQACKGGSKVIPPEKPTADISRGAKASKSTKGKDDGAT